MIIDLSQIEFFYDFYSLPLPSGDTLILNSVDENFTIDNVDTEIKCINLVVALEDGSASYSVPSIIGMKNQFFTLNTDYTEYEGKRLNIDNIKYCKLEVEDV